MPPTESAAESSHISSSMLFLYEKNTNTLTTTIFTTVFGNRGSTLG